MFKNRKASAMANIFTYPFAYSQVEAQPNLSIKGVMSGAENKFTHTTGLAITGNVV